MDEFQDFLDEYDDLTERLLRARYQDFASLAKRVLLMFDHAPAATSTRIQWLRSLFPIEKIEAEVLVEPKGMVGSGRMNWPQDLEQSLGAQINLLASFTVKDDRAWQFARDYFYSRSNNINDTLHEMTGHLLEPMFRDLRRYLVRQRNNPVEINEIPAADRIVRIDHNQPSYQEAIGSIASASEALIGDNAIGTDDRDRIKFELDAGILLLHAQTVTISAIEAVLIRALRWLSANFAGAALGIAAERALSAVLLLLGGS
ncbi:MULTISPECIES: hypothetical protein [unclassified Mesorhizobium]|uniref:hypothetical protein n=1 Tax=unclassified Mesorhizobium TaxID=325217 RepID=UPI000BB099A1|nr:MULTISPECIES: hypothetical protein [unclassified Mesorhizobium]PBC23476.1 hypothetical protein CK226_10140 [Mesorhizobium sp. WSM4311]TRD06842.1 hypothetical protein FJV82_08935 [Mesorhizobium sp. WSM4305]